MGWPEWDMHCWNCTKRDQSTEHSVLRSLFDILQMALIQQNIIQNKFLIFCIHMVQCIQNLVHSRILLSITFREKIRQEIFQPDIQFVTEQTEHLMNAAAFAKMKHSAIFINVGRGPIVVEADLADALEQGTIAAAGLDVLSVEPMREDNPLRRIKDSERLVITPHIAWAAVETRKRLMEIILQQVKEFFERR